MGQPLIRVEIVADSAGLKVRVAIAPSILNQVYAREGLALFDRSNANVAVELRDTRDGRSFERQPAWSDSSPGPRIRRSTRRSSALGVRSSSRRRSLSAAGTDDGRYHLPIALRKSAMRGRVAMRLLRSGLVLSVLSFALLAPPAQAATHTGNLIKNGGGESAVGSSNGSTVPTPKWKLGTGTGFTAVQYGASGGFPTATDPGPAKRGNNFLAGGPDGDVVATQTAKVGTYATAIDNGTVTYALVGWLGGFSSQGDEAFVEIDFKDANGAFLDSATLGPVTAADRGT